MESSYESRYEYETTSITSSLGGESASESRDYSPSSTSSDDTFNSLEDVDRLIARLESSLGKTDEGSSKINNLLLERKRKIAELHNLVKEAREAEKEQKLAREIKQQMEELDKAAMFVKNKVSGR